MSPRIYTADWLITDHRTIINHGALAVQDSYILAAGAQKQIVAKYPYAERTDYPDCVITPGFVNLHTHTELTAMRGFLDDVEHDFFAWLKRLTVARSQAMTTDDLYVSAAWGAVEAVRAGVTCLGDAADSGATSLRALHDVGLRGIVYQELFGIDEQVAHDQLAKLKTKVQHLREQLNAYQTNTNQSNTNQSSNANQINYPLSATRYPLIQIGISPHAPYTVSKRLIELASRYAIDESLPVMMHAAESQAESAFMRQGTGAFAEGLNMRGIAWTPPRVSTIRYLYERGLLQTKLLLAHCITVDDADLELIKQFGASIAHCPKSNLKLGHGRAPFARMLKRKINVGFGSDSVASNNTNDLLEESRFALLLARLKREDAEGATFEVSVTEALETLTSGGARALGLNDQIGTLDPGKQADFVAVNLTGAHQLPVHDATSALISASSARDVIATVIAGREVYRDGRVTTINEDELRVKVNELGQRLKKYRG